MNRIRIPHGPASRLSLRRTLQPVIVALVALVFIASVTPVVAQSADESEAPDTGDTVEFPNPIAAAEPGIIFGETFDSDDWWMDPLWLDYREIDIDRNEIVDDGYQSTGLGVEIPPGGRRGSGALYLLPDGLEDAWFRYHIRFDAWNAGDSGKLPGFADIGATTARGCKPSTAADPGWSTRILFEEPTEPNGPIQLGYYTYHVNQPGTCGEFMLWNAANGTLDQDRWYCVEGRVAMNTPGLNDGKLVAWVDGKLVFNRTNLQYRRTGEEWVNVNTFWLNVYFGGSSVVNDKTLGLRFDELVIDDEKIGCLTRFTDDDDSPHEGSIEALFDLGLVAGCSQNLFCPARSMTRAEWVVLVDRYFGLPAASVDAFTDDDGHWAEAVLNRAAAAGVLKGCGPGLSCPNEAVTREEVAAFIDRSFKLPDASADYFSDDDGSIFEGNINALAEVGITSGCEVDRFCGERDIPRDQAAALFARAIAWYEG